MMKTGQSKVKFPVSIMQDTVMQPAQLRGHPPSSTNLIIRQSESISNKTFFTLFWFHRLQGRVSAHPSWWESPLWKKGGIGN